MPLTNLLILGHHFRLSFESLKFLSHNFSWPLRLFMGHNFNWPSNSYGSQKYLLILRHNFWWPSNTCKAIKWGLFVDHNFSWPSNIVRSLKYLLFLRHNFSWSSKTFVGFRTYLKFSVRAFLWLFRKSFNITTNFHLLNSILR